MVMATCRAATASDGPCQITAGGPGVGGGIGAGAVTAGGGGVVGAVVVDPGAGCRPGCTRLAATAAIRGLVSLPARTLAIPTPRRPRSARRLIPRQCAQVMMLLRDGTRRSAAS